MNSLPFFQSQLERRIVALSLTFQNVLQLRNTTKRADRYSIQAGLILHTWQAWNSFSRFVILASVLGTTTANRTTVNSNYSHRSIDDIRYAAFQVARNNPIRFPSTTSGFIMEPTWGDVTKAILIINAFFPSNRNRLLSAFGSSSLITHLQKIRNACAHISPDGFRDIQGLCVHYDNPHYFHPSDCIFWIDPNNGNYSWESWVYEMKEVAKDSVS